MPDPAHIRTAHEGAVAVLWIENPPRNLLSLSMVADLAARVADLEKDDSVRAAVLAGAGHANFCAGLDMAEWSRLSLKAAQDEMSRGQDAFWALEHLTKPTIAAIAGAARGAGAELALAC
ncbi:MAG: enoyl-CoA hydratase/isomerase family protein, partial [Methanobacteriota archaeon]